MIRPSAIISGQNIEARMKAFNTSIKATGIKRGTFFIPANCASALSVFVRLIYNEDNINNYSLPSRIDNSSSRTSFNHCGNCVRL